MLTFIEIFIKIGLLMNMLERKKLKSLFFFVRYGRTNVLNNNIVFEKSF